MTLKMRNTSSTHLGPASTLHVTNKQMSNCSHECDWHYYEKLLSKHHFANFQSNFHTVKKKKNEHPNFEITCSNLNMVRVHHAQFVLDEGGHEYMNAWDNYGVFVGYYAVYYGIWRGSVLKLEKWGTQNNPFLSLSCSFCSFRFLIKAFIIIIYLTLQ